MSDNYNILSEVWAFSAIEIVSKKFKMNVEKFCCYWHKEPLEPQYDFWSECFKKEQFVWLNAISSKTDDKSLLLFSWKFLSLKSFVSN